MAMWRLRDRLDPHQIKDTWYALSGSTRLVWVASLGLVAAALVSSVTSCSNAYSVRARTAIVVVEPSCSRSIVWDLPPGRFAATSADAPPPLDPGAASVDSPPRLASVRLAAGSRARIERVGDGELSIRFERSPQFGNCASADSVVAVQIHGLDEPRLPAQALTVRKGKGEVDHIVYRSAAGASEFVLPLEGRIIAGTELQHGAGWQDSGPPALLDNAEVQVRSLEGATGHSVGLREERVDIGGIVDSMPCFALGPSLVDRVRLLGQSPSLAIDRGAHRNEACARALTAPALGLVRAHREGGMESQMHVVAQHLGVTAHQGQTREFGVPLWQSLTHSHLVQAIVVFVILLGGADAAITMLYKIYAPNTDEERKAGRRSSLRGPSQVGREPPRSNAE
jgi:hypothetical protein